MVYVSQNATNRLMETIEKQNDEVNKQNKRIVKQNRILKIFSILIFILALISLYFSIWK